MQYYVYILANKMRTTIYIDFTNNLLRRIYEHRHDMDPGSFSAKYQVHDLVYFESTSDVYAAMEREKQLKKMESGKKKQTG